MTAAHRQDFPVRLMCRLLAVSPAGGYAAQRRPPSARTQADGRLRVLVRAAFAPAQQRYGSPRVNQRLRRDGTRVSAKRVARLMQEEALVARRPRRAVRTTDSAHAWPLAPNLVARDFAVARPLDTAWVADVTYIPTDAGWLYLAVVLDLASRRVLGWATGPQNDTGLALTAMQRALAVRRPATGLVHHSDRGSVYASHAYRAVLDAHGIACSMSRRLTDIGASARSRRASSRRSSGSCSPRTASPRTRAPPAPSWSSLTAGTIENDCTPASATGARSSTSRTCVAPRTQLKPGVHEIG